jgi:uncharacterized membrane protein YbhN (UPF0104 family)
VGAWLPWAGVLGLLALLIAAVHPAALLAALHHASLWLLVPVVGCSLAALVLRAIRWHLLVHAIAAPNTLADSLILFTAAQAAQLVPGGLLLLPVLQRSQFGTPVRRSTPTVLVQDLLFGLLVLPAALPGVLPYPPAAGLLVMALVFNAGTGLMLWQGRALHWGLRLGQHVPVLRDHVRTLAEVQESFVTVATSPTVLWGAVLDMGAIGLAGLGLWLCLQAVGATHTPWVDSVAIYGLGTSAGTLSALPGGVGANEDVSTLVLTHMGVAAGTAAAATLLFRATTVPMRMALGWIVLLVAGPRLKIQISRDGLVAAIQGAEKQTRAGEQAREAPGQ